MGAELSRRQTIWKVLAKIKRLGYGLYYISNGEVTKNLRKWSRGVWVCQSSIENCNRCVEYSQGVVRVRYSNWYPQKLRGQKRRRA